MATALGKFLNTNLTNQLANFNIIVRNGHHIRGKPPGIAKSLQTKLSEAKITIDRVDISLPPPSISKPKRSQERLDVFRTIRKDKALEKAAREQKLLIDLEECHNEWLKNNGVKQLTMIGDHYGIFKDLFGEAYFHPRVPMRIAYKVNDSELLAFFGNVLKPSDTKNKPQVSFASEKNDLWSLILTNPDGHLTNQSSECIHWFIGNIPGNNVEKGDTLIEYLQPFPPKGTGYQRLIFILYKQNKKLDLNQYKKEGKCLNLSERTFSNLDFYRKFQDDITPAGLAFFQCDWDPSLKAFFHETLNMKEPIFEYDFPPPYIKPQKWFPKREAFNLYMDKYRDPKQINKEFLERKLKDEHPFKPHPAPLKYPNAVRFEKYIPSWLKLEMRKSRMQLGRINDIK